MAVYLLYGTCYLKFYLFIFLFLLFKPHFYSFNWCFLATVKLLFFFLFKLLLLTAPLSVMSNEKSGNADMEATLIKARFGNDVRKVSLHHNEDISYDDLCIMMQRIFKIESSANITLKYRDDG